MLGGSSAKEEVDQETLANCFVRNCYRVVIACERMSSVCNVLRDFLLEGSNPEEIGYYQMLLHEFRHCFDL